MKPVYYVRRDRSGLGFARYTIVGLHTPEEMPIRIIRTPSYSDETWKVRRNLWLELIDPTLIAIPVVDGDYVTTMADVFRLEDVLTVNAAAAIAN